MYLPARNVKMTEAKKMLFTLTSERASACRLLLVDGHDEAMSTQMIEEIIALAIESGAQALVTSRNSVPRSLAPYFSVLPLAPVSRADNLSILKQSGVTGPKAKNWQQN
jgi:hypothetical protein